MTAAPTTTKPRPDQVALRNLMRRLAEATSTEAPIISVYLDVRPDAHGERPAERREQIVVRDLLRQLTDRFRSIATTAPSKGCAGRSRADHGDLGTGSPEWASSTTRSPSGCWRSIASSRG